jgi:hypothetical protein
LTIDPSTKKPYLLGPGHILDIQVDVVINSIDPASMPFTDVVGVDYNDPMYTPAVGKHPPLYSKDSFYPIGDPVVYPNPYNPDSGVPLIFDNVVPGSLDTDIYALGRESGGHTGACDKSDMGREEHEGYYRVTGDILFCDTQPDHGTGKKGEAVCNTRKLGKIKKLKCKTKKYNL